MITTLSAHAITVTPGPFGRAHLECPCGIERVFASKRAANRAGLVHHHRVNGGCTCPSEVVAHETHPDLHSTTHQEGTPA